MRSSALHFFATLLAACVLVGCGVGDGADDVPAPGDPGVFESDPPNNQGAGGGISADAGAGSGGAAGAGTGGAGATGGSGGGDAQKTIEEADIIQIEESRLYALSQYSGLSVIDVANPDAMKVLGRFRFAGMPFEMYVKAGVVHAMYSSIPVYKQSGSGWASEQTSGIVTLDASAPAAIKKLTEFTIPGEISDSRKVGEVLYVVSYENGYCYKCRETESTTVLSLNLTNPTQVQKVDELAFSAAKKSYSWGKRSVMVNQDRMYIAGREWNGKNASSIQIVDISDPSGKLVAGANFEAEGMIESRWQLDEKDGYLRVISQPGVWSIGEPPHLSTYQIQSSNSVLKVADVKMVLPEPERLRSARFDGDRAYAITFRQTDPLFAIDFSDPTAPKQLGELEIPGWVYHMEPRGDRLLALGFDQGNKDGSLNVSLFDVADMTAPKMLSRVHFGGNGWGNFAEDQDRIHKAFSIYDALGLIFVPYSGRSYGNGIGYGCSSWNSGVQIVSFDDNALKKRGNAPARGQARRALLHKSRLLAVSDVSVESFDIGNLDAPSSKDEVRLASITSKTAIVGDRVARLGANWWTSNPTLDVTKRSDVEDPQPLSSLELRDVFKSKEDCKSYYYGGHSYELHSDGQTVFVLQLGATSKIAAVDISGPKAVVKGVASLEGAQPSGYYPHYYGYYGRSHVVDTGSRWVGAGAKLAFLRPKDDAVDPYLDPAKPRGAIIDVVDFTTPSAPKLTSIELPESLGFTGLHVAGTQLLLSRWIPSPTTPGKVRFYVERIDVTGTPKRQAAVNVPGSLFATNAQSNKILTLDYAKVKEHLSYQDCVDKWGYGAVVDPSKYYGDYGYGGAGSSTLKCVGIKRSVKHVSLGTSIAKQNAAKELPHGYSFYNTAVGADRVFANYSCHDCGSYGGAYGDAMMVFSGLETGKITFAQATLDTDANYFYASHMVADGHRLVAAGGYPARLVVLDASVASSPKVVGKQVLGSYSVRHVSIQGDQALCSLGDFGASWVQLPQ